MQTEPLRENPSWRTGARARQGFGAMAGLAILLLLVGWLFGRFMAPSRNREDTGPILQAVQKLGDLHSVQFNLSDVLRQESQNDPSGWVRAIPGASEITHWATHNQATVVATGTVEAGVNLSLLTEKDVVTVHNPDGSSSIHVHLPPVTVYPPNVKLKVEHTESGLFWRDENIVPKAQAEASRIFLETAQQGGIRQKAQENAVRTLQQVERALGYKDVVFEF